VIYLDLIAVLLVLSVFGCALAQEQQQQQQANQPQYWQHNEKTKQWQPIMPESANAQQQQQPPQPPQQQQQQPPQQQQPQQLGTLIGSVDNSNAYAQPAPPQPHPLPQPIQHQPAKPVYGQPQSLIQLPSLYPAAPAPIAVPAPAYPQAVPVPIHPVPLAPFAIQQPGISSYGEPIIENLIGGIPFDCRGLPTGPVRDNRFCDIFHACVFGQQRKTYACPFVGERTYFDMLTLRCEFVRKNPLGCSANTYYH
jgi:hypothetical protein